MSTQTHTHIYIHTYYTTVPLVPSRSWLNELTNPQSGRSHVDDDFACKTCKKTVERSANRCFFKDLTSRNYSDYRASIQRLFVSDAMFLLCQINIDFPSIDCHVKYPIYQYR